MNNLANKITFSRIILASVILFLLVFPWQDIGLSFPSIIVAGKIIVDVKYLIAGILFLCAMLTDFLDGFMAKNDQNATDFGAILDNVADKILINGILFVLAFNGFVGIIVPIVVCFRDIVVDGIRILVAKNGVILKTNKYSKIKTFCMYLGILLSFFYNLPFEIWGIFVSEILIDIATIFSVITGCIYYNEWKEKYKKLDEKI